MRFQIAVGLGLAVSSYGFAQVPDVRTKVDIIGSYRTGGSKEPTLFRFYEPQGRVSTVGLTLLLEPGFRAFVSQRLQRIDNDPDRDALDEYYLEDPGLWRVGRQYLPFGSGQIFRESVIAARTDTNLIIEKLPLSIAYCDAGKGLASGVVGRIGRQFGVSFAVGNHFGISGTTLGVIRSLENSPGRGRGWRQVLGADWNRGGGPLTFKLEYLNFSRGETASDVDMSVIDVSGTVTPSKFQTFTFGYTRQNGDRADFYRLAASFFLTKNASLEPLIRYGEKSLRDLTIVLHVKL